MSKMSKCKYIMLQDQGIALVRSNRTQVRRKKSNHGKERDSATGHTVIIERERAGDGHRRAGRKYLGGEICDVYSTMGP